MATGYFPGTNIPLDDFKGTDEKRTELARRLQQDLNNKDIKGMNDAIFSVAYWSLGGEGKGQGNPNVSKIHNGTWQVNADAFEGADVTWAEDNINSEGDAYIQKSGKKKGKTVEFNDKVGTLVDGVSTGNWGGWDNTEQWTNPITGKVEDNPYHFAGPGGSGTPKPPPESGVKVDTSIYDKGVTTGNPDWITTGYNPSGGKFVDQKWTDRNVESGAAGATNLLNYRPWTKNYWSENISRDPAAQGLLYSGLPQQEYGLAYLPGEHRDPGAWHDWVMGGHKGQPPGGGWRTQPSQYKVGADRTTSAVTGDAFPSYFKKGSRVPWQFTAPGSLPGKPRYNIDFSPWNATSTNLSPTQGAEWQGFLSNLGDTPMVDASPTSLLGDSSGAVKTYKTSTIYN